MGRPRRAHLTVCGLQASEIPWGLDALGNVMGREIIVAVTLVAMLLPACQRADPTLSVCEVLERGMYEPTGSFQVRGELVGIHDMVFLAPDEACSSQLALQIEKAEGRMPDGRPLRLFLLDLADQNGTTFGAVKGVFRVQLHHLFAGDILRANIQSVEDLSEATIGAARVEQIVLGKVR